LTRKDKEEDRCEHVRITNSHSGPIFLTYRDNIEINNIVASVTSQSPENDLVALDGIRHQSWIIKDKEVIKKIPSIFKTIPNLYIADGHHRSAAAARVGKERAKANPNHHGDEEYNFYLAVYFPASQLHIMDYNRLVKDLCGMTKEEFFVKLKTNFDIVEASAQVKPAKKDDFGMYLEGKWYTLSAGIALQNITDPVLRLDVSILQNYVLDPILGIKDPRIDKRVDFVGGIRGLDELERRVNSGEMKVAFSMFPTSVAELMAIADDDKLMPPKSTWFEPKLRDGLFVHFLD
jgi:uncharacterized protein (DUF1015 family)